MIIQESAARCMNTFSPFGYCLFNRYFPFSDAHRDENRNTRLFTMQKTI